VWLVGKVGPARADSPNLGRLWIIKAVIAIGFGLAHLPNWSTMTTLTPLVVGVVVLLNSEGLAKAFV